MRHDLWGRRGHKGTPVKDLPDVKRTKEQIDFSHNRRLKNKLRKGPLGAHSTYNRRRLKHGRTQGTAPPKIGRVATQSQRSRQSGRR